MQDLYSRVIIHHRFHTWVLSPPRHMTKLNRNPEDGGGVGTYGRLKRKETTSEENKDILIVCVCLEEVNLSFKWHPQGYKTPGDLYPCDVNVNFMMDDWRLTIHDFA